MRDSRASVLALGIAVCLTAALACQTAADAAAKVRSHSNINNNRTFNSACANAGGKVSITNSQSVCVLPSIAVKGEGVPDSLRDACVKDGGKISQQNGATTCVGA